MYLYIQKSYFLQQIRILAYDQNVKISYHVIH